MKGHRHPIRAVSFDAYGTLLRLDRPFERLSMELNRIGLRVPMDTVSRVFLGEMGYYREHHLEGNTPETLRRLRLRCADLLFRMLEQEGYPAEASQEQRLEVLMHAIRFDLYEDALSSLNWCRAHDLPTAVISAWDCSLAATLGELCTHPFSAVVVSAVEGIGKSGPALFLRAAEALGLEPSQILHVGDEVENDLQAAEKAGFTSVLIDRNRAHPDIAPNRIETLDRLPAFLQGPLGVASRS